CSLKKDERSRGRKDVKREVNVELLHNGAAPAIIQVCRQEFGARIEYCSAPPPPAPRHSLLP
ncbi:MAG TPA: hypothetical protein VIX61_11895, partial [Casimicrobiaceae bacterium]